MCNSLRRSHLNPFLKGEETDSIFDIRHFRNQDKRLGKMKRNMEEDLI